MHNFMKHDMCSVVGSSSAKELDDALNKFKKVSDPVRVAERKVAAAEKPAKATAKSKAKAKAAGK